MMYLLMGFDESNGVQLLTRRVFTDISHVEHYRDTVNPSWKPFIAHVNETAFYNAINHANNQVEQA